MTTPSSKNALVVFITGCSNGGIGAALYVNTNTLYINSLIIIRGLQSCRIFATWLLGLR